MSAQKPASWAYAEDFAVEDEVLASARRRGEELGATPVAPSVGATLRSLAAATAARAVVEIGTGAGVSGLWLLGGMPADGVLTTIDVDAEHQRAAREAYGAAGFPHQRTRVIQGRALDVLDRMTDGGLRPGPRRRRDDRVPRVRRPGDPAAAHRRPARRRHMLFRDKVADPAARDDVTRTLRDLGKQLRDDAGFTTTLLPVGDGLLVAVKRG